MSIRDYDGTTYYTIGSIRDYDGTTYSTIGKVYDNDGTASSLIYSLEEVIADTSSSSLGNATTTNVYIGYDSGYGRGVEFVSGSGIKVYGWYVHNYWLEFKHIFANKITNNGYSKLYIQFAGKAGPTVTGHSSQLKFDVYINDTRKNMTKEWSFSNTQEDISGTFTIDVSSLTSFTLGFFVNIYGYINWDIFVNKIWLE